MSLLVAIYSVAAHADRPRSMIHGLGIVGTSMTVVVVGVLIPHESLAWYADPGQWRPVRGGLDPG